MENSTNFNKEGIIDHTGYLEVDKTFNEQMKTSCRIYVDNELRTVVKNEDVLLKQISQVASLPGIVGEVIGLPDIHLGYGFPIGSVVAFDMEDSRSIIAPGGVGYDINCGVRAIRTNIKLKDIKGKEEEIAQKLFDSIPSGLAFENSSTATSGITISVKELNRILDGGLEYLVSTGAISEDNLEYTESRGKIKGNSKLVSQKAKGKGINQLCSLGSGNHYLEIQYVSEVYEEEIAKVLGIKENQIIISIHTGSRGLGHTVCQDYLDIMYKDSIDYYKGMPKELSSAPIASQASQDYQLAMGSASNYAFCNRALISEKAKKVLKEYFEDFEAELVYDVCHNIAKEEVYGSKRCLIHRKGASRILEPHHPELPQKYKEIGQPVLVGGSMGTCSFLLVGDTNAPSTFRSTCHGAGRVVSRKDSKIKFTYEEVFNELKEQNIVVKCGSTNGLVEEAPSCYKDVDSVVDISQRIGVSKKVCKVKPVIVIKG
ncbi:tRNA-splicing ligase RtcB like protein [Nosema granulosis]|uniref:3'-phosphate/5'-hydroxy nucleic acid ligase n=1 Tax=Nosema granulosis TaxID=83296 RepID=A0A9P6GW10_9MICR|nr:tRNA-splicing ligase RtcB like protein [Nosema granulosis]